MFIVRKKTLYYLCLLSLFTTSFLYVGCKPSNPQGRLAVSGTVKVNGEPLDEGTIMFNPTNAATVKTPSSAGVKNGTYSMPVEKGLAPADYTVRFFSAKGTGKIDENNPMKSEIFVQTIPARYNVASKEKVTVSKDATSFDFDLDIKSSEIKR